MTISSFALRNDQCIVNPHGSTCNTEDELYIQVLCHIHMHTHQFIYIYIYIIYKYIYILLNRIGYYFNALLTRIEPL